MVSYKLLLSISIISFLLADLQIFQISSFHWSYLVKRSLRVLKMFQAINCLSISLNIHQFVLFKKCFKSKLIEGKEINLHSLQLWKMIDRWSWLHIFWNMSRLCWKGPWNVFRIKVACGTRIIQKMLTSKMKCYTFRFLL